MHHALYAPRSYRELTGCDASIQTKNRIRNRLRIPFLMQQGLPYARPASSFLHNVSVIHGRLFLTVSGSSIHALTIFAYTSGVPILFCSS